MDRGISLCLVQFKHANGRLNANHEALIETHYLKRWSVADYAKTLSVTPTHLNRVTRAATGDTASHLILNRLIREARRNLVYTNLPVSSDLTTPLISAGSMPPRPAGHRGPSAQILGGEARSRD
jgi:methylphosphotriester-DNA--protein-cysteine methyltransferase